MYKRQVLSPSKVTSTCTGPFSVSIVDPDTTVDVVPPDPADDDTDGVAAGAAVSVVVDDDPVSVEGA